MSLLLCRQEAKLPYYNEKMNLRLFSEQELCYVIYHYPLLVLEDFLTEDLFLWMERELSLSALSGKLRREAAKGERVENLLLLILSECNYYSLPEINAYKARIMEIGSYGRAEYCHAVGVTLFGLDRLQGAAECFEEAISALDLRLRKAEDAKEKELLLRRKADCYCDLASVRLRFFDEKKALELLAASELFCKTKRALRMRYFVSGEADISEEEKAALQKEKEAAKKAVLESEPYMAVKAGFEKDRQSRLEETKGQLALWKEQYRAML